MSVSEQTTIMTVSGGTGPLTWDDATWILTSAFIIFTMQSGRSAQVRSGQVRVFNVSGTGWGGGGGGGSKGDRLHWRVQGSTSSPTGGCLRCYGIWNVP